MVGFPSLVSVSGACARARAFVRLCVWTSREMVPMCGEGREGSFGYPPAIMMLCYVMLYYIILCHVILYCIVFFWIPATLAIVPESDHNQKEKARPLSQGVGKKSSRTELEAELDSILRVS
jgi:hypothetical protein